MESETVTKRKTSNETNKKTDSLDDEEEIGLKAKMTLINGVTVIVGAYCYAELGTMIKKSGADYAYIMETFGPFLAFIRLWIECMIVRPCSQAIVALTFSVYVLKPFFPDCQPPDDAARILAFCCICTLTFVNCWDVKWATAVQDIFTYAKLLALFVIIAAGLYFLLNELQDPVKNLPRAIAISCTLVTVVYFFTNVAFYTILSPEEVLGSEAVAVTFADRCFGLFAWTIPVFVALSTFGAVNGILLTSSRLFYAGACEGQMPEILTMIQIHRLTPTPAVLIMALLSMLYLMSSNIFALINYVGFATWLSIGAAVLCLPWLRWKQPDLQRPIKVNLLFPIFYLLATLFVVIVPMIASPVETGYGCLMILSSIPVYAVCVAWKNKPKWFNKSLSVMTTILQKLLMVLGKSNKPAQV
uniref:CSON003997 protein n=1 Tax=Culicoides sonorensis TaxID=179676 RepID=A0A336MMR8_CULSO